MDPIDLLTQNLDKLLLAVVFFPAVAAVIVGLASSAGPGAARRAAAYTGATQLILTAMLAFLAGSVLGSGTRTSTGKFQPIAVPGDPGHNGVAGTYTG
ncbi:MAG: hypothetical protein ACRCZF_11735, partial [Gemmataceae bacterium]